MAVTDWIDRIAIIFEIADGKGGTLTSYRPYDKGEFPEAINDFPCAIHYITDVRNQYSLGGPCIDYYNGVSEFHLVASTAKSLLPYCMTFLTRIRDAAAANMNLGGRCDHFLLRMDEPSQQGPVALQYGDENPHWGIVVRWEVKENVTGDFVPGAGS
jgi:hypothetical protein